MAVCNIRGATCISDALIGFDIPSAVGLVVLGTLAFVKEYNAFYPQPSNSVLEVLAQSFYILFVLLVRRILKMQLQNYKSRTRSKYHLKPSSRREIRKGEMLFIHISKVANVKTKRREHN